MKIYNTKAEIDADLDEAGNLNIQDDIDIRCDCTIKGNISAGDITARGISAWNITAGDISARDISARNISYYAVCVAYQTFTCRAVKGRREKSLHACLDSAIIFKKAKTEEQ